MCKGEKINQIDLKTNEIIKHRFIDGGKIQKIMHFNKVIKLEKQWVLEICFRST